MGDGFYATLVSADENQNTSTNPMYVQLTDGTDSSLIDGSGNLNVILAANSGTDIGDVDVTSVIPGTGATNLGKAVDSAGGATDTGVATLAIRDDALSALTPAEGDYARLRVDSTGALWVNDTGTAAPTETDDAAFTIATDAVSPCGYLGDETAPDSIDEGDIGLARMTLDRKQLMVITDASTDSQRLAIDASGNANVILAANSGTDIGDVDVTSVVPGTGATNLGKAEDAAHTTGDVGVMALAVRQDTQVDFGADGDYVPLSINANGALRVDLETAAPSETDDAAFTVATDKVTPCGYLGDETAPDSVDEGDIGLARMTLDRKQLMVLADATTDSQRLAINASGEAQVDLAAVSVTAVPVSKDSSANSETNPLFVQVVTSAVSSNEVHDYDTATVAGSGTDNHNYTVTGSTFLLRSVQYSSSGAMKVEVQTGPTASLATVMVDFIPKWGGGNQVHFEPAKEVLPTGTGIVRIIRTNREGSSNDVYSLIMGNDVA